MIDQKVVNRIIRLYELGHSRPNIAQQLKVSEESVRKYLKAAQTNRGFYQRRLPHEVGESVVIPLTNGHWTIVDRADYIRFPDLKGNWYAHPRGKKIYAMSTNDDGRLVGMARYIMDAPMGMEVDHIDGNSLNNRRSNLRVCTPQQNRCNVSKQDRATSSQFKGVCWVDSMNKWRAAITSERKFHLLGWFTDEFEAAKKYDHAAKMYHGEYAKLNFPA